MAIETINPATGARVRSFAALNEREIEDRLATVHRTAATWRLAPLAERANVVRRAGELLEERKTEYGRLMTLEMGKT
ncbi:MAG TPA: aldehyde dehydrogenase family protein, partial [Gemmatimonadaceae bacterium]